MLYIIKRNGSLAFCVKDFLAVIAFMTAWDTSNINNGRESSWIRREKEKKYP